MKTLFFALLFPLTTHAILVDRTAAVINSDVVTLSDTLFFRKNINLRKELDPFVSYFQRIPQSDQEIVSHLIQEVLVMQKINPPKEDVELEISAILKNNRIDREKLKEVLTAQGIRFDDYYAMMKVSVAKRQLIDRELRPFAIVSEEEIKNTYYTDPQYLDRRKSKRMAISYDLEQLLLPSATSVEAARQMLKAGNDLESVAATLESRGVELDRLGMLSEEKLSPLVRKALEGLRVGEYSEPMNTGSGYFILRIREIGAPKDEQFERAKEEIRQKLFQKSLTRQLELWTEREKAAAYIHIP